MNSVIQFNGECFRLFGMGNDIPRIDLKYKFKWRDEEKMRNRGREIHKNILTTYGRKQMKDSKMQKTYLLFALILGLFIALSGCSEGGGGEWNQPVNPTDTTRPTVTFTDPATVAAPGVPTSGVAINQKISATFSEVMESATLTAATFYLTQGGAAVPGSVTYSGATAVFTPASNLAAGTTFIATLTTGAKDPGGNALAADYTWSFTTSAALDTTAPRVTLTVPANAATAVPIANKITATFNESMDPLTITNSTFTVKNGATAVSGALLYSGRTATFTPTGNLAANTTFTATITTGAKDLAGNGLTGNYVWSFTTGAAPDTTSPTVSFTSPANGATAVPLNRIANAAFSEAMDPLTVTTATFTLKQTGSGINVPGSVVAIGPSAAFTPLSNLLAATEYTATITTGAKDLAGNALASNHTWSFTTGAAPDTTSPTVSFTSPANGSIAVPLNRKLNVSFSEAMAPLSVTTASFSLQETISGNNVPGTVVSLGTSATFTPLSNLAATTQYTATITSGATDLAGNALASAYIWSFTTGAATDLTKPTVSFTSPTDGAIAVPLNRKINVAFSEEMDPLTITTVSFKVTGPGLTAVAGAVSYIDSTATFIPLANLPASTLFTCTITTGAADLAGNTLAVNYVWHFTTGVAQDTTAPSVISTSPLDLATGVAINKIVNATFSEAMDPLTIATTSYSLRETLSGNDVPGTVTYVAASNTARFNPLSDLAFNTDYTATITGGIGGVADLAGNVLTADKVWSFATGAAPDITAPTVILVNPADAAVGVELNSSVNATFSEAMDPLTINSATFTVAGELGVVTYDPLADIATFNPSSNLVANTTYTATISTMATDEAGNGLVVDEVWSFTTGTGLAPGAVALGSAGTFGIMATSAVTNIGNTTINGDVSLDPGTSMTGFPPGVVNGTIHINDTVSAQARIDLLTAYNFATSLPPGTTISAGADLGALYPTGIPPGTYTSGSTMLVGTPLTLDAGGNADAVWVFQIGSSLTTGASVSLANGAQAKNVFWVPQLDATIGVGTIFHGTIVSGRDVTGVTGATINGRILAGATTAGTIALDTNTVNVPAP
jgi:hypothetical protein